MMMLFEGYDKAYGTYNSKATSLNDVKGGKVEIKATARTRRDLVTRELWEEHLSGDSPIGIIPIRDNDTCLWGCIDIDVYDISFGEIVELVEKEKLPLVCCRTKSGGVHAFLFMAEPVPADVLQMRLKEMAALLGYGTAEVFPKQRSVALERGDLGSWLNMPYFDEANTDRYGLKRGGGAMTLVEFLVRAESLQQPRVFTEQQFRKTPKKVKDDGKGEPDFGNGPPCMQHLTATGFPEGQRNKGLFALGSFAKKKYGARWAEVLEEWNRRFFESPLPSAEVMQIIKSHEKKDYNYTCREHPLSAHCNSTLCRTRKFGVGGEDDFPLISGLSVMKTTPPLWFLDVGDKRMELSTDQLQNYTLFHKVCMEQLYVCFKTMKQDAWLTLVAVAMKEAVEIDAPVESGTPGRFMELVEDFVLNRHRAEARDEIMLGRPWESQEDGRHYFRLRDLEAFLERAGFKTYSRGQMVARIRGMGGNKHVFNIKGKCVNVFWVPSMFVPTPALDLPHIEKEPI